MSTHFPSSLRANLAIDAAVSSSTSVTWIPGTWNNQLESQQRVGSIDSEEEEEEEEDELGDGWNESHQQNRSNKDGIAVCQVVRGSIRYIAPVKSDSKFSLLSFVSIIVIQKAYPFFSPLQSIL